MEGCAQSCREGSTYTRPAGGMNVWVSLPEPLDASELAVKAAAEGVSYLPGQIFRSDPAADARVAIEFCGDGAGRDFGAG